MLEKNIESYLVKKIKNLKGLTFKFVSPGNIGVPDRIILFNRKVYFVELKAPNKKPRPSQIIQFRKIAEHYEEVIILDSISKIDEFVERIKSNV